MIIQADAFKASDARGSVSLETCAPVASGCAARALAGRANSLRPAFALVNGAGALADRASAERVVEAEQPWLQRRIGDAAARADQALAEAAGAIKATTKMSLADCFAAALAKQKQTAVYTGDPEFKAVQDDVKVIWL